MKRKRHPKLPIVVVTDYSEGLPLEEPDRLVVLRKPFPTSLLALTIRSMFGV